MRKSQVREAFLIAAVLSALLSGFSAYGQKPPKRGVKDAAEVSPPTLQVGSYYALAIGINDYRYLPHLQTAVNDATALANLLQEQYGFKEKKLLLNPTRDQILIALNDYKRRLPADSSLLIYYAGHGYRDPATQRAYWLPADAEPDNDVFWISASSITDEISGLHSTHVLVISDSCYSGGLTRDPGIAPSPAERDIYLKRMLESPSRTLMASGRNEPVADGGREGHSIFAYALIQSLRQVPEDGFTAGDLFHRYIQQEVAGGSDQVPQYSIIQHSGHEFGDFVFSRDGKGVAVASAKVAVIEGGPGHVGKPPELLPSVVQTVNPEADRYAVNQVVSAYADSYNRRDAASLWKIWPGAPQGTKQAIQSSFGSAQSISMKINDRSIEIFDTTATVTGQYSQEFMPKNGSLQRSNGVITLGLEKRNGTWVITAIK
jgi:hypothetical protein